MHTDMKPGGEWSEPGCELPLQVSLGVKGSADVSILQSRAMFLRSLSTKEISEA